jgi:DNA-binding XRE family transcriptional regulator
MSPSGHKGGDIMAKSFKILREKMSPKAQQRSKEKTRLMLEAMPLQELRQARALSQNEMAKELGIKQAAVSKLERRTDMYLSTLRKFIEAMGGHLEIVAHFPEGDVSVEQFEALDEKRAGSPA